MMAVGLYQDLKIVVSSFGIRQVRLYNVYCRDIKIQVIGFLSFLFFFLFSLSFSFVNFFFFFASGIG